MLQLQSLHSVCKKTLNFLKKTMGFFIFQPANAKEGIKKIAFAYFVIFVAATLLLSSIFFFSSHSAASTFTYWFV